MKENNLISTYTGLKINPLDPDPNKICVEDICHSLSNLCRFTGHCNEFYSVAQHSVHVSVLASRENALWGLLHDASEAYLSDISRPIKMSEDFYQYRCIEQNFMRVVAIKFGLDVVMPKEINTLDTTLLVTEARDLGLLSKGWDCYNVKPLDTKIHPQLPKAAKQSFMDWYNVIINRK